MAIDKSVLDAAVGAYEAARERDVPAIWLPLDTNQRRWLAEALEEYHRHVGRAEAIYAHVEDVRAAKDIAFGAKAYSAKDMREAAAHVAEAYFTGVLMGSAQGLAAKIRTLPLTFWNPREAQAERLNDLAGLDSAGHVAPPPAGMKSDPTPSPWGSPEAFFFFWGIRCVPGVENTLDGQG